MARNVEVDIQEITRLRQRVRKAEEQATAARVRHDQAKGDLKAAEDAARSIGIDPKDVKAFDKWIVDEAEAIERLLSKATDKLNEVQEVLNE